MKRLLFVCVENANRSQMAEAFARMHAPPGVEVYSAGSAPGERVSPRAVAAMRARGYDLSTHRPRSLEQIPPGPYEWIVTMGCGDACPSLTAGQREDWALPDPRDLDEPAYAAVRDEIEQRVRALLSRIG